MYESEYEQSILRYSVDLFPGYVCVPFKATVQSDIGNVQADLVLVDRDYRGWTIVEVELEHHPLMGHVEPQMRKLINGRYTDAHASAIALASEDLDEERVRRLVANVPPEFLVIAPVEAPDWRPTFATSVSALPWFSCSLTRRTRGCCFTKGTGRLRGRPTSSRDCRCNPDSCHAPCEPTRPRPFRKKARFPLNSKDSSRVGEFCGHNGRLSSCRTALWTWTLTRDIGSCVVIPTS